MKKLFLLVVVAIFAISLVACAPIIEKGKWVETYFSEQTVPKGTIMLTNKPVSFPGDSESHEKDGKALAGVIIFMGDKITLTTSRVWVYLTDYEIMTDSMDLIQEYQNRFKTDVTPKFYFVGH